ncbi:hypothetical protein ACJ7V3_17615 [Halomonas elongata]|uniref:hypothetical protein n=1 Tax=Halomonas elongata TaxID=2746 RepID=UPI0038D4B48C
MLRFFLYFIKEDKKSVNMVVKYRKEKALFSLSVWLVVFLVSFPFGEINVFLATGVGVAMFLSQLLLCLLSRKGMVLYIFICVGLVLLGWSVGREVIGLSVEEGAGGEILLVGIVGFISLSFACESLCFLLMRWVEALRR